jgi:tetratricopeptide (TPR) repeat protein
VAFGRKQVALSGEPAERSRILLELAQVLEERLSRPSAAATALEEALADDPSNRRAAERLALFHYHGADWERAKELLEKVVEGDPEPEGLHEHHYRLGFAEEQLGHEEEAFAQYVKSFGRQPLYLPTLERLVEICYLRRQWDNTLRIAGAIVSTYDSEKTPEELADLYLRIGLCELHLAQREVALVRLRDLVLQRGEAPSTPPEAWLDVADCWAATPLDRQLLPQVPHEVLGRVEKAMERALDLVPDHPGPPQVLAATALALGEWDRMLHFIERAVESPKVERDLRVGLLLCAGDVLLHRLQAHDRAREYCRRALVIWPDSAAAKKRMAAMDETPSEGLLPTIPLPQIDAPAVASPAPPPPFRATANQPPPLPPRSPAGTAPRPAPRSKPRKPDEEQ